MLTTYSEMLCRPALNTATNNAVLRHCFGSSLPVESSLTAKALEAENIFQLTTYLNLLQLKYRSGSKLLPILFTINSVSRIIEGLNESKSSM